MRYKMYSLASVARSQSLLLALTGVFLGGMAALGANYAVTQGSGTTFGAVTVGGVNYAQHFLCDLTTPAQCAAVSAGGATKTDGSGIAAIAPVVSTAAEANHIIKASAGSLFGFHVTTGASGGFGVVFAASSASADGAGNPKMLLHVGRARTRTFSGGGAPPESFCP